MFIISSYKIFILSLCSIIIDSINGKDKKACLKKAILNNLPPPQCIVEGVKLQISGF
jgi:hypothetical protein